MLLAGASVTDVTRICVMHFHGDHCLGLPGVIQRLSLDHVPHPVDAYFPASGREYFARLRYACAFYETARLREWPGDRAGPVATTPIGTLSVQPLEHPVDSYGYRLVEPDGVRMVPESLAALGISGPAVGQLQREGFIEVDGRTVGLDQVSEPRPGQRFAFVMDTRICDGVWALAEGVDLLVIGATFLQEDADLAHRFGHLTAAQAARVATESGVRRLVLTHFSQRYPDPVAFEREARQHFDGDLVVAQDLMRVPVPPRR